MTGINKINFNPNLNNTGPTPQAKEAKASPNSIFSGQIANNALNEHFHGDKTCPATHKEDKSDCT